MTEQFDGQHLGGEALRIVSAVQDWTRRTFPDGATDNAAEHADGTCQWCPLCRAVAMLRGERPDVTERVAGAGAAVLAAVRAFLDATAPQPRDGGAGAARPDGAARPRVHRIDLGDDDLEGDDPEGGAG